MPVWKQGGGPEDVLEAMRWAQTNDAKVGQTASLRRACNQRALSAASRARE